ncbi:hypothetical protein [Salinibacillus xinjiangensis]|uniref:Uncharacterized protein n=1 Tax=Salinibacillus xinjiangensis TaxID=1229268 RepID=A0A6G1X7W9_9BACI|nr:hypothetical protein [Salinibacillus xinjiangensis]MRG87006.1 hypothetical protein [Salinibacillus xinjiangensis]
MANLNFSFEKAYDTISINDKDYKLYYDDDSLRKYQDQALKYKKEVDKYLKKQKKIENMTEQQQKELEEKGMVFVREFVETFYGEGSYETLYQASGKSMINFMPLIEYTLDWLDSKVPDLDEKKKAYYTKKRK